MEVTTKQAAQEALKVHARYFWNLCQWGFHPDTAAANYVNRSGKQSFNQTKAAEFDGNRYECFRLADRFDLDIYDVMMDAFHEFEKTDKLELQRLANVAVTEEWGSEKQVEAENAFGDLIAHYMTDGERQRWEAYCLKATTEEMISAAFSITKIEWQKPELCTMCGKPATLQNELGMAFCEPCVHKLHPDAVIGETK